MRDKDKGFIAKTGGLVGSLAILCCISPVIFALLGLMSATAAIALGNNLFDNYKIYFIGASLLFLAAAVIYYLKKKNQCSIDGARKNINLILLTFLIAVLVYIFWYYFTTWLAILYGG